MIKHLHLQQLLAPDRDAFFGELLVAPAATTTLPETSVDTTTKFTKPVTTALTSSSCLPLIGMNSVVICL
jgi:hypothetical protein